MSYGCNQHTSVRGIGIMLALQINTSASRDEKLWRHASSEENGEVLGMGAAEGRAAGAVGGLDPIDCASA